MALSPRLKEEEIRQFLADGGKIVTARQMDRLQLQFTAVSRTGRLLRGILSKKFHRELMLREKYETPYIVELPPGEHSEDVEHVGVYSVSLPRTKRVIALRYEDQSATTSSDSQPKRKRIRTAAQLLGEKDDFCCRTCFKRFPRKFNLQRHEENCLPKPINFHCPVCQRKYQKATYFAAHIKMHEEKERKRKSASNHLAIEMADMEEERRKAEKSVEKLAIPYEFGKFY